MALVEATSFVLVHVFRQADGSEERVTLIYRSRDFREPVAGENIQITDVVANKAYRGTVKSVVRNTMLSQASVGTFLMSETITIQIDAVPQVKALA